MSSTHTKKEREREVLGLLVHQRSYSPTKIFKTDSMNYIAPPTVYFQQDDELCFRTSIPHHTHIIQSMVTDRSSMFVNTCQELETGKSKKVGAPIFHGEGGDESLQISRKKKKIIHRDVERQRRQEMSMLYMSLRSQLPHEYLKGKRSISDHMTEAANYINHLKMKIQELTEKRDQLRSAIFSSSNLRSPYPQGSSSSPHISVTETLTGAAIVIAGKPGYEFPLSRAIGALVEEGLNVVNVVNVQSIYNIECESDHPRVDRLGLEQKLRNSIFLTN